MAEPDLDRLFMPQLTRLLLSYNGLTGRHQHASALLGLLPTVSAGTLPEAISNCNQLEFLDLSHNMFQGENYVFLSALRFC